MSTTPVVLRRPEDGLAELHLDHPPGNVLDGPLLACLGEAVEEIAATDARAVLLTAAGRHFSFGASVEEHLPESVRTMLGALHGLFRRLVALRRPLVCAVRGQCLGGGLELAAFCHRVFAHPEAVLGQPEMRLGVFAPVASLVLPRRVGQAAADHLLLSGATVGAEEALARGLVDALADDPEAAALAYAREHLAGKSLPAIRCAVQAARHEFDAALLAGIEHVERLYLDELMTHRDPVEGLGAFLEKRRPTWTHT